MEGMTLEEVAGVQVRVWEKSFQIVDGPFVSLVIYTGHGGKKLLATVTQAVALYKDARTFQHAVDVAAQIPAPLKRN